MIEFSKEQQQWIDSNCMLLPKDMNGEPIHVGDVMAFDRFGGQHRRLVKHVSPDGFAGYEIYPTSGKPFDEYVADWHYHYKPPTVRDVLDELCLEYVRSWNGEASAKERGEIVAKYAAKLQIRKED